MNCKIYKAVIIMIILATIIASWLGLINSAIRGLLLELVVISLMITALVTEKKKKYEMVIILFAIVLLSIDAIRLFVIGI